MTTPLAAPNVFEVPATELPSLGGLRCRVLYDGYSSYEAPLKTFFGSSSSSSAASSALVSSALSETSTLPSVPLEAWQSIPVPYLCLLVEVANPDGTSPFLVLIDTGAGKPTNPDPDPAPSTGLLLRSLAMAQIQPEQITHVVLTHAHPGHVNGLAQEQDKDKGMKAVFPNARVFLHQLEYEYYTKAEGRLKESQQYHEDSELVKRTLAAIPADKVYLLHGDKQTEEEVIPEVPGAVTSRLTPGHTPGSISVTVGRKFTWMGDAFMQPAHVVQPGLTAAFDVDGEAMMATRMSIAERAVDNKLLVGCSHFPFPGVGRILCKKGEAGFTWSPLSSNVNVDLLL